MLKKEEILLIGYLIAVILVLVAFLVIFFYVFQRRKNKLLFERWEAEKRFEQEISNSRMEIQEQTLKNIGMELHDNIGQLLSVAKMQLNMLVPSLELPVREQAKELGEVISSSLKEVRSLSRSLNNEVINYIGLEKSVVNELERFDRLQLLKTTIDIKGTRREIDQRKSVILFRILQEFFSNVIKHSKASRLEVEMTYGKSLLIELRDNGKGFDLEEIAKGSGLLNMENRAQLIGAEFDLHSEVGKGTTLKIEYPFEKE